MKTVLIGGGYRGKALLKLMRAIPFFEPVAVADPGLGSPGVPGGNPGAVSGSNPGASSDTDCFAGLKIYSDGPEDYRRMLAELKPELAVICSPWHCHIPQAAACLDAGCKVALEIRGGLEEGEYQPLIDRGGKVFPMENIIFRRDLLAVREMVRKGLFGEIVYMKGCYRHDLRSTLVNASGEFGGPAPGPFPGKPYEPWRAKAYTTENADIYPTHSIAPLCLIGDVHSLAELTSFSSKSAGLRERLGPSCPKITMGDIVNTVARTSDGKLLTLIHDTTLPRPRSYGIEIQGTRGIWEEDTHRIYVQGRSPEEEWESDAPYIEEFLDPMWRKWGSEATAADSHHGGMDYIMLKAIAEDLSGGAAYPASLADLVLWTSVTPLSSRSIAEGSTVKL
ncbi:MAG: gfo/Idh/MocA family oxidoreductase [Bacteroidales bacterium]|nr:gfo/Idh/MocA family oxidoreductase [Bacteroidales bacterium]